MNLPSPNAGYDQLNEAQARSQIEAEDEKNVKKGAVLNSLKFRDTVTGEVVTVSIASGALVIA